MRLFYRPGPIPAGLSAEIAIEVYAIAAGVQSGRSGVGCVEHHLQLFTDTDILHVPIALRVMTAHAYDQQPDLRIAPSVELVAKGAPVREGIIRPRRDVSDACCSHWSIVCSAVYLNSAVFGALKVKWRKTDDYNANFGRA